MPAGACSSGLATLALLDEHSRLAPDEPVVTAQYAGANAGQEPLVVAAWGQVSIVQVALSLARPAAPFNLTASAVVRLAGLGSEAHQLAATSAPVFLVRHVNVTSPVAPARRRGLFADPLVPLGPRTPVFAGDGNTTVVLFIPVSVPASGLPGQGPAAAALGNVTLHVAMHGRGGATTTCAATVRLGVTARSNVTLPLTDSAFDATGVAAVVARRKLDPQSNANMIDALRSGGVTSLVYADLSPRPLVYLNDSRTGTVAECNVSAWARLVSAARRPDVPSPTDVPIPWQQPSGASPLPVPPGTGAGGATPRPRTPLAAVRRVGFPMPAGAQRWFGGSHRLPTASTVFRFIFESSYSNERVFDDDGNVSATFRTLYGGVMGAIERQVDAAGLLGMTHRVLVDEPALESDPETRRNFATLARLHCELQPRVPLWQTASVDGIASLPDDVAAGCVRTWVVNSPSRDGWLRLSRHVSDAARRLGLATPPDLVLYDNGVPALDLPLLRQRLFQWGAYQPGNPESGVFSANGTLAGAACAGTLSFYTVAAWGGASQEVSVWQDPSAMDPTHRRPGWGMLLYPPEEGTPAAPPAGPVVPVSSLRFEATRSGLQDAAVLARLVDLVSRPSACDATTTCVGRARTAARAVLHDSSALVSPWIPLAWSRTWRDSFANDAYTTNTALVESVRRRALVSLERLGR